MHAWEIRLTFSFSNKQSQCLHRIPSHFRCRPLLLPHVDLRLKSCELQLLLLDKVEDVWVWPWGGLVAPAEFRLYTDTVILIAWYLWVSPLRNKRAETWLVSLDVIIVIHLLFFVIHRLLLLLLLPYQLKARGHHENTTHLSLFRFSAICNYSDIDRLWRPHQSIRVKLVLHCEFRCVLQWGRCIELLRCRRH